MAYQVGDTVLCPPHGRAVIEAIEPRRVRDQERTYAVLRVADAAGLVVRVPVADLERRRGHHLPDPDELAQVLTVLRPEPLRRRVCRGRNCAVRTRRLWPPGMSCESQASCEI